MTIRIGGVQYGVGAPLLAGLAEDPSVHLTVDVPTRLIAALRAGTLDAALVSSIEAFRRAGYRIAPELGIACCGPVRSVRAFRRLSPDGAPLPIRTVGLDAGSETSVALLKILLDTRWHTPDAVFERVTPTLSPDSLPQDLILLIGDCGLHADPGQRQVIDLGEAWHSLTALPFVFALWLIHPGADAAAVVAALLKARAEAVRRAVDDGTNGALYYTLGAPERQGLFRFRAEAVRLGLAEPDILPEFL